MSTITDKSCPNYRYTTCPGLLRYYPPSWWDKLVGRQGYYLCAGCGDHFWESYVEEVLSG